MKKDEVFSMLGLSKKAGKIKAGNFAVDQAIKSKKAYLVVAAEDASERTKKDIQNACDYYETPYFFHGSKEELGNAIGKEYVAEVCVTDKKMAASIITKHEKAKQEE